MPIRLSSRTNKSLVSKGAQYQILFSYKQDSSKEIFRAFKNDGPAGVKQEVLLKIFLSEKNTCREEFESLSKVCSPYCVRLFGFENFVNKKALVLEYIKGISLFQLIENFSLKIKEIRYILTCIYKGLQDLNKQGLCHGDLSLDNVLIDEKAHIKLIDFGKANYEQTPQGTPPFIAPEIFKGARANFLSDLFSLGIIEAVFKTPYPLSSLKEMELKDFDSDSPLLSLDPKKRFFPYDVNNKLRKRDLSSLSYKVKELLSVIEARRCPTLKDPKVKKTSPFFFIKPLVLLFGLTFFGMDSSQTFLPQQGLIKIYTNKWFFVSVGDFKSYTPLNLPLKAGWHSIQWKNQFAKGEIKIFVSRGETLFLNDKNFSTKKVFP